MALDVNRIAQVFGILDFHLRLAVGVIFCIKIRWPNNGTNRTVISESLAPFPSRAKLCPRL